MKTLTDAIRHLLLQMPHFAIPKQGYKIKEYISIIDFVKGNKKIMQEDYAHIRKLIEDKTVLKWYWSTEMQEDYQYLALMLLGIEWLIYTAQFEDAQKGKTILEKKIRKETYVQKRSLPQNR